MNILKKLNEKYDAINNEIIRGLILIDLVVPAIILVVLGSELRSITMVIIGFSWLITLFMFRISYNGRTVLRSLGLIKRGNNNE